MLQNYISDDNSGDHWGVSYNSSKRSVLVQLQENGEQVRIQLTPEQATHMIQKLEQSLEKINNLKLKV